MRFRTQVAILIGIYASITAGCDPGLTYQPIDAKGKVATNVSQEVDGVRFEAVPYSTLVGSGSIDYALAVVNSSNKPVTALSAELKTNGRSWNAKLANPKESQTVKSGGAGEFGMYCNVMEQGLPRC